MNTLATPSQAIAEWAINARGPADQAWILSDRDSWERNPRYDGPPQDHPERIDAGAPLYARGYAAAALEARRSAARTGVAHAIIPVEGYPQWFEITTRGWFK